jgi:hypothetical protein
LITAEKVYKILKANPFAVKYPPGRAVILKGNQHAAHGNVTKDNVKQYYRNSHDVDIFVFPNVFYQIFCNAHHDRPLKLWLS